MSFLGNIIWLIFGGFMIAIEFFIASLLLMISIVGIPFGLQTIKLGSLAMWPFGREAVSTHHASGCLSVFMNVLWILIGGIWIALSHLFWGVVLCITIIGIPFGKQHFKLASVALTPFGREIRYKN
ncbi:YccF domain-containing protein [Labilibacter sediminis]|nr:YccF domain-containing protein [Labilibacter sediminis]